MGDFYPRYDPVSELAAVTAEIAMHQAQVQYHQAKIEYYTYRANALAEVVCDAEPLDISSAGSVDGAGGLQGDKAGFDQARLVDESNRADRAPDDVDTLRDRYEGLPSPDEAGVDDPGSGIQVDDRDDDLDDDDLDDELDDDDLDDEGDEPEM